MNENQLDIPKETKEVHALADGGSYQGEMKNGKKHGQGIVRYPDGTVQAGRFRENEFLGSQPSSEEK